jgi:hypothetical protein
MIPKKSNRTDVDNLRTIYLFEVDANYCFKHIGRQMMKNAECHGTIAKEQYGSRKKHSTGAVCSNDAKACYDLIGHTPASICMQRQGVPKTAVKCIFTTLQEAIHHVRTAFGDSDLSYGGSGWIKPLHGIGQGNGGGPPIWAVISSTLLDILRSIGFGLKLISPITLMLLAFVSYSFIDDTDIVQSDGSSAASTIQKLQDAVDTWEGCLKITGGALSPEKSFWYLTSFRWSGE